LSVLLKNSNGSVQTVGVGFTNIVFDYGLDIVDSQTSDRPLHKAR